MIVVFLTWKNDGCALLLWHVVKFSLVQLSNLRLEKNYGRKNILLLHLE